MDFVFDVCECSSEKEKLENARYGRYPNEEWCRVWAEALFEKIRE